MTTVLAIDPGSAKCGMALVQRDDDHAIHLRWRAIVSPENVPDQIAEAIEIAPIKLCVVGSGTTHRELVHAIRERFPAMGILVVNERDTTMQARERYWEHYRRRGWRRLVPATMQVPPEPVDDFVAMILAERVLLD